MRRIKFQGKEWLFVGDSLEQGGAITTDEDYANGTCSYSHLFWNGNVMRYAEKIGTRDQIEDLGECEGPEPTEDAVINCRTHPSW